MNLPPDRGCCGLSLGGEAFGNKWLVRRSVRAIHGPRAVFFVDLGEQRSLGRGGRPLLFRMIIGETAGPEGYGAQFGEDDIARSPLTAQQGE